MVIACFALFLKPLKQGLSFPHGKTFPFR